MPDDKPTNVATSTSGPFVAETSTITLAGQQWLSMKMTLTQSLMVPLRGANEQRRVELEAEQTVLGMLGDRVAEALEDLNQEE